MSFACLLIHTCDISSFAEGDPDDYGTPVKTWTVIYPDQACRLMATTGREIKVGAEVVISDWKLFVGKSVVVTERDRISDIRLASTEVALDSSTFEILLVQPKSDGHSGHHYELALQKVA